MWGRSIKLQGLKRGDILSNYKVKNGGRKVVYGIYKKALLTESSTFQEFPFQTDLRAEMKAYLPVL